MSLRENVGSWQFRDAPAKRIPRWADKPPPERFRLPVFALRGEEIIQPLRLTAPGVSGPVAFPEFLTPAATVATLPCNRLLQLGYKLLH